ncbi:MAG: aminoacyl-tRNA hydrolase [Candidatus Nealsonbacteria bacterium]
MKIIIGLGNPEKKYQLTRHNLGRLIIENFQKEIKSPDFRLKKKFQALISESKISKDKIILALPETFMNSSGRAVKSLTANYKMPIKNIWVVHDDFDIELGKLRISKNKSSGGHKGIQSIINELKTKDFIRFRIGIKPKRRPKNLDKFVLKKFTKQEKETIKEAVKKCIEALEFALEQGLEKAMNEYNK